VLSEDLIAKELSVEVGFVTLIKPISNWWDKKDKKVVSDNRIPVQKVNPEKEDQAA